MPDSTQRPYVIGICVALALGFLAALAGSANGLELAGLPIFAWAVILAFLIQWLAFVPAWLSHTEHFFDMVGSLTYLAVVALALVGAGSTGAYPLLLASMVAIWATRLGWFLSARIRKVGFDSRFDVMKHQFIWFLMTWTLQGLWVVLTAGAALAALTAGSRQEVGLAGFTGFLLWTVGLGIEVAADEQKRRFRAREENKDSFISTGLWALSRHPNYLGEIILWTGIAIAALPSLSGWSYATLISPLFVCVLLTRVSGIPMLEAASDRRWAGDPAYEAYKANTPPLRFKFR